MRKGVPWDRRLTYVLIFESVTYIRPTQAERLCLRCNFISERPADMASSSPAVNIANLSEDQQLALQQFTSVTDQELDAALPLLERCQWNAQVTSPSYTM